MAVSHFSCLALHYFHLPRQPDSPFFSLPLSIFSPHMCLYQYRQITVFRYRMYVDAAVIEARLDELESYLKLEGRDKSIVVNILKAIESMGDKATFPALRGEHIAGTDTFRIFLKWLFKKKLIEKQAKKKVEKYGRTPRHYKLTNEGKEALNYFEIPEYKEVKFIRYGKTGKKLVLQIRQRTKNNQWGAKNLNADELIHLIKSGVRKALLLEIETPYLLTEEAMRTEIELSKQQGDKTLSKFIEWILTYSGKALLEEVDEETTVEEAPNLKLMRDEVILSIFPSSNSHLFPSFDPCLQFGFAGETTFGQIAAINAYQKVWRKIWGTNIEKNKIIQDLRRLLFKKVGRKWVWRSRLCKEWIKQRLKENPNYFAPSPIWAKLGFKVSREWDGAVLFPYNIVLVEPRFAWILASTNRPFFIMAEEGELVINHMKKGIDYIDDDFLYHLIKRFESFLSMLQHFQNNSNFYEAWRIKKESLTLSNKCYKELIVFKPLQEAFHQYIKRRFKPTVDLYKAYSQVFLDLSKGKEPTNAFNDVSADIAKGKYPIKC